MKKLFTVLLSVLMILSLAACSSSSADSTPAADTSAAKISEATSIADLSGFKVAAQTGTFHVDALGQIDGVVASTLPDFTDLLIALKAGTIDGYVAEEPTALAVCGSDPELTYLPFVNNSTGFTATDEDTGVAVGLVKGSDLTAQINEILADLTVDVQRELMSEVIAITNGETVTSFVLESETPANPVGVLKVGMECAYEPYNWTETGANSYGCVPISGEGKDGLYANGFDVQVAQYVANKLNMSLEVYSLEWDSLIPAVQSGTVDAIIAGMSPTAERATQIDFTDCYYNSNLVVIIRAGE
ncbi:MAG: transporter substrate-binding domain-containing protein [Erysipelotrichaceae bacterium]|nr:transporter substrate-binding domain-containing protein [Erysipelotrichaceae bacterium]